MIWNWDRMPIDADILEKGSIVLNSKMFGDIVRRLPDSEVLIEVKENNTVIIECDNSHFELRVCLLTAFRHCLQLKKRT